jgi:hypothetical protein
VEQNEALGNLSFRVTTDTSEPKREVESLRQSVRGLGQDIRQGLAMGAAFAGVNAAMSAVRDTVVSIRQSFLGYNQQMENAVTQMTAFTKSATTAAEIVQRLQKEADITPFDTGEMIEAGKSLVAVARGSADELMRLVKVAEILAAIDPVQGLRGAAYALREAMSGDFRSVAARFEISREAIHRFLSLIHISEPTRPCH